MAEKRLDSIRGIVTSKRMHAWFAVFSTIHSRILLTECASESLYSVQNIAIHRIRLIFDSSNTLVYRLGPSTYNCTKSKSMTIATAEPTPGLNLLCNHAPFIFFSNLQFSLFPHFTAPNQPTKQTSQLFRDPTGLICLNPAAV